MSDREFTEKLLSAMRDGLRVFVTRDGIDLSEGQIEERARNLVQAIHCVEYQREDARAA